MEIIVTIGAIDGYSQGEIADYPADMAVKLVSAGFAEYADGAVASQGVDDSVDLADLKIGELRERCKELGLPANGKKEELAARIAAAMADGDAYDAEDGESDDDEPPALEAEVPR